MRHRGLTLAVACAFGLAVLNAAPALSVPSFTPGGCATVNSGGFNHTNTTAFTTTSRSISGFAVGDVITFQIVRSNGGLGSDGTFFTLFDVNHSQVASSNDTVTTSLVYTVTGPDDLSLTAQLEHAGHDGTLTATCAAASSGGSTNNDSGKLRTVQVLGSKIVAQTSGNAISGATGTAIGEALGEGATSGGTGSGGTGQGGTGGGPAFAPPSGLGGPGSGQSALGGPRSRQGSGAAGFGQQSSVMRHDWHAWASVRGTDVERTGSNSGFTGDQVNATFGLGYRLSRDVVVGVLGGWERFDYEVRALAGTLKGDGWTAGAYAGWRLAPGLQLDVTGAYSGIDYDATAGTAAGSFGGHRWLASAGLTGTYGLGVVVVEPSARVHALWEDQNAYTDNLGTRQAQRSFSAGRASGGARFLYPLQLGGGATLSPYAGLYADYYFSGDTALPAGQEALGIADGWSARAVGGLALGLGSAATLSVGTELGGIGADHKALSFTGRGAIRF